MTPQNLTQSLYQNNIKFRPKKLLIREKNIISNFFLERKKKKKNPTQDVNFPYHYERVYHTPRRSVKQILSSFHVVVRIRTPRNPSYTKTRNEKRECSLPASLSLSKNSIINSSFKLTFNGGKFLCSVKSRWAQPAVEAQTRRYTGELCRHGSFLFGPAGDLSIGPVKSGFPGSLVGGFHLGVEIASQLSISC